MKLIYWLVILLLGLKIATGNCANMMSRVNLEVIEKSGNTRRLHIQKLRNLGKEIDLLGQQFHNDNIKGYGASFAGGACAFVAGVATIATGGLALPMLGLGSLGSMIGVFGGVWNILGTMKKSEHEERIKKEINNIVEEDDALREEVRHEIEKYNILDRSEKVAIGEKILAIVKGGSSVFISFGPDMACTALTRALPPIRIFFKTIPTIMSFLGVAGKEASNYFAQGAVKEIGNEAIREAVEKAGKTLPNNWSKRYIIENTYGVIFKENSGKLPVKLTAEGAEAFTDDVAKEIAKQAKNTAQWVGGLTAGIGVITCIWDLSNIYDSWGKSGEGSTTVLGVALREIAKKMEASIDNTNRNIGG